MYKCAFCRQPLAWKSAWRGRQHLLYCNEFCAETEDIDLARTQPDHLAASEQYDGR